MPIDTGIWAPWGTGTQDESGGSLNQSATGVSGEYVGVSSVTNYDLTNKTLQVHIRQLPTNTAGVQAYFRAEVDTNNGIVFGFGDGNLFCQTHLAGVYATPVAISWPAGTIGLRLVFDNAQNKLWYASTIDGTTWTVRHAMNLPIATTSLKVILATGCYSTVASPGTTKWESVGSVIDLTPTDTYGSTIYGTSGLTAYWRLADNSTTFLRDSSPSGNHHGTYTGNPGFGQAGPGALTDPSTDFTGADDTAGWPEVFPLSGSFTLECWVKADNWVDFASIFNRRRWEVSEGGITLEVRNDYARETMGVPPVEPRAPGDGYIYCFLYSTAWAWVSNDTPLTAGEWHHIVFAYDVSVTTIWMYVDGVFEAGSPSAGVLNPITSPNVSIQIGRNVEYGQLFDGKIDEMALYNRALTAQEVADHYALGSASPGLMPAVTSGGKATVTSLLTRERALIAASAGVATATATATRRRSLTVTSTGGSTASGAISRKKTIPTVSTAGVATTTALIGRKRHLTVSSAGVASVSQALTRKRALVGSSAGVAAEVGQPTRIRPLVVTSVGVASASGTIIKTVYIDLTASSAGTSTAVGTVSSRPPTLLLFSDDFQRANSSTIGGLWVEDQGDWEIYDNNLRAFTYGTALAYNTTPLGTGDYRVLATITAGNLWDAGGRGLGLVARYQDANNYYLAWVDSTPPVIKLYKVESGNYTVIGSYSGDTPTDPVTVSLICDGTTIKILGEGNIERVSVEDSTFSSGYFGVRTFNAADFMGHRFNDVSVYSLELPGAITGGTVGSSTTSSVLSVKKALTGASTASSVTTAQITRRRALVVSTAGVAISAGTVGRKVALTAASAGIATEVGQPTVKRRLVAASAGIAVTTAVATRYRSLTGASAGIATDVGQPTRTRPLTASATGVATTSATVSKGTAFKAITGSATGSAVTTATIAVKRPITGASTGGSTATAQPARKRHFVVTSIGVAVTTATILRKSAIVATATGVATVSATLVATRRLVAASAGTSIANGVVQKLGAQIFPAQRATATAQELVAEIKAGAVFSAAQMSATGQMHVSTAILGTTFPAVLLNATASKPIASILSGLRFQGELATASAQKLVAQYKTGTVFQGVLSTATAQSLVGTVVLGTRFNAVLANASGTSYPLTVQLGTGFQAQLMQSTASAHALTLRAGAVWPAAATSVSVQSLTAVMRTSNGFLGQLASGTASLQLATFRFGVRITAQVMSASVQTFPLAIAASGLFLAQRMQATADIKAATIISSNVWQAQVMLANAESYFVTYRVGTSFLAALAVVNGLLRIAVFKESFGVTSPGPDIIWSEHVVPVITSADQLVPYIVGSGEPVPVIVNGELLLPYLYGKDELVPIIVSSEEV